jgi:hypothetical protein
VPSSVSLRLASLENLNEQVSSLFLNFNQPLDKALAMQRSDCKAVFESKAFEDWKKGREAQGTRFLAICERLDNLVRAIGGLGKAMAARRIR